MPSKLLIAAADVAHSARHAAPFGVHVDNVRIDGAADATCSQRTRSFCGLRASDDIDGFDASEKLTGHARFLSDTTLQVVKTRVEARSVVIGGVVTRYSGRFLSLGDRVIVNDDVFDWETLPTSILVVGTGVIKVRTGPGA